MNLSKLWLILTLLTLLTLQVLTVTAGKLLLSKLKVVKTNKFTVLRQRSSSGNGDEPSKLTKPINYDDIYSEWSAWSRCRKRCKQVRTRRCSSANICQSTILKEERTCTGDKCQPRYLTATKNTTTTTTTTTGGNNPLNNSRGRGQFRVLYHLQSYVYSQWSDWSACTSTCHTRRYRVCEMKNVCGNSTIHEDALCYTPGSHCEQLYQSKAEEAMPTQPVNLTNPNVIDDDKCGQTDFHNDPTRLLRIIGGREASKGRWPWMVALLNKHKEPFCGGTLITPQFVVTAAHCVRRRMHVRAGEHDLMFKEGSEQELRVSAVFIHPDYDAETVDNDIALLKLKKPLAMNRFVSPICLPEANEVLPVQTRGTILGWGKRRNTEVFGSDVLLQAMVPIADTDDCKKVYENYYISDNMVCAGYKKGRIDSCAGDSGGPFLFSRPVGRNGQDKFYLYGVTSFGEGCGKKGRYGIYAKVPNFVNWIRQTIAAH